jgi:hypothetical protein
MKTWRKGKNHIRHKLRPKARRSWQERKQGWPIQPFWDQYNSNTIISNWNSSNTILSIYFSGHYKKMTPAVRPSLKKGKNSKRIIIEVHTENHKSEWGPNARAEILGLRNPTNQYFTNAITNKQKQASHFSLTKPKKITPTPKITKN